MQSEYDKYVFNKFIQTVTAFAFCFTNQIVTNSSPQAFQALCLLTIATACKFICDIDPKNFDQCDIDPKDLDQGPIDPFIEKRDLIMAKGVMRSIQQMETRKSLLVVIGYLHVQGVIESLEKETKKISWTLRTPQGPKPLAM